MDEDDRGEEITRLRQQLADARARRAALLEELIHLSARMPEIRKTFGNPFYYSRPEEPDEGIANYTGNASHEVAGPTLSAFLRVNREVERIRAELRRRGDDDTSP